MKKSRFAELDKKAQKAMRKAVSEVVKEHKKTGTSLSIWKNGKVVNVSPSKL